MRSRRESPFWSIRQPYRLSDPSSWEMGQDRHTIRGFIRKNDATFVVFSHALSVTILPLSLSRVEITALTHQSR